ncbi:MAG: TIM barrel protein [Edaphobacter sp.]
MPNLSCADFTFPLLTRSQVFSLLRLLDFNFVDIGLFERNAHVQTSAMMASPKQFVKDLVEDLKRSKLHASDVFLQIGISPRYASTNDPNAKVRTENREVLERSLELCSALSCKHMTGLPGVIHGDSQRDFACAVEETHWRVEVCQAAGITYAIEPHIGSICADIISTRQLLDAVAGLTLTLDYGHFIAAGHNSEEVHLLLPAASHLHLRGGAPGCLQTSVAENTIDFSALLDGLRRLNFDGFMALEYVWIDWEGCNRSDTLSETLLLRQAVAALADSMQWKVG